MSEKMPDEVIIWKVKVLPNLIETEFGCWEWAGRRMPRGYGTFSYKGKNHFTHRVSYEANIGAIPPGHHVCHRCDNPPCCNPAHLFSGTPRENLADALAKGRLPTGGDARNAKITDDQVRAIRNDSRSGPVIAKEYGISHSHVKNIRRRVRRKSA